ncbi:hypothetical protein FRC12_007114 [Ceratobasidium sp. 428]|nr:hypothetical protein FRC12_007114 [Ceratobasidium sp. 428]
MSEPSSQRFFEFIGSIGNLTTACVKHSVENRPQTSSHVMNELIMLRQVNKKAFNISVVVTRKLLQAMASGEKAETSKKLEDTLREGKQQTVASEAAHSSAALSFSNSFDDNSNQDHGVFEQEQIGIATRLLGMLQVNITGDADKSNNLG